MEFWHETLTQKSWNILLDLKKKPFTFILIGGWAAYLWTHLHKSKDVDIILPDIKDLDYLKKNFMLKKNDSLKKYEISLQEIDVDIYVPYYSMLTLPVEELKKHVTKIEGINVLTPEALLILKQGAEEERAHSTKGDKDRIDIMSLIFFANVDLERYDELLTTYGLRRFRTRLRTTITSFKDIHYFNMNLRAFTLKKKETLNRLRGQPSRK